MKPRRSCELCENEASLYCDADSAFLCWSCDHRVHAANFLVARHVRRVSCAECCSIDGVRLVSGAGSPPIRCVCRSCDGDILDPPPSSPSTSASSCVSASESTADSTATMAKPPETRRSDSDSPRRRAVEVMVEWSGAMGLRRRRECVREAVRVLKAGGGVMTVLPFRVSTAAAIWFAVKICESGGDTCQNEVLRRLEACSGVPAEVIVVAESRLARVVGRRRRRRRRRRFVKEGWAECS